MAPEWLQSQMERWRRIMEWEIMLPALGEWTINGLNDPKELSEGCKNIGPMHDLLANYDTIEDVYGKSVFEWIPMEKFDQDAGYCFCKLEKCSDRQWCV
jgi:hypothetical protein